MSLLTYPPLLRAENRLILLLDKTFLKAADVRTLDYARELPRNAKKWFGSATFSKQLDKIIADIIKHSLLYADSQLKTLAAASAGESAILTTEAVRMSKDLSAEVAESIVRMLDDDAIYYQHPNKLARRIEDLWGGERYKAVRFARTFTADVATASTVNRYRQYNVRYMEFDAKINHRTSDQCRCLNGTIFDLEKTSVDAYRPPLHQHCRSGLKPLANSELDESRLFENRDFNNALDDPKKVEKAFKKIDVFNEKYRVSQYVLDQDIATRMMFEKGVSVSIPRNLVDVLESTAKQAVVKYRATLTAEELDAINTYTYKRNGKASMWNECLWQRKPIPTEDIETVDRLSEVLQRAPPFFGPSYRGLKFMSADARDVFLSQFTVGTEHRFDTFSSSSMLLSKAEEFAKGEHGVIIKYMSKQGVYLNGLSAYPEEYEVLFDRNTAVMIVSIYHDGKYTIIEVVDP